MVRIKLTVAYLGDRFSGWQRQPHRRTVQGDLEACLQTLDHDRPVTVVGAGRTDAGVHAAAQVAHVDLAAPIAPEVLPAIMNRRLASDLRVRAAVAVPDTFHARKSARGKHYAYRVRWSEPELPWQHPRSAVMPVMTEIDAVCRLCRRLPGRRDWASFSVPEVAERATVRTIFRIDLRRRRDGIELHFIGEGFLRYQVRRMVGALAAVGHGRLAPESFADLVARPTPGAPVPTAPACGLSLERVFYRASPKLATSGGGDDPLW